MRFLKLFLLALLVPAAALAATPAPTAASNAINGGVGLPQVNIFCSDANNNPTVCSFGGGGSSGGAVTQSGTWQVNLGYGGSVVSGTNPLGTSDLALDALISGGRLAVSLASLPLPSGAATAGNQMSPQATVAPAAATATQSLLIGCQANTLLPAFTAGQQGAIPCDTSGRPYVNASGVNAPVYLQAVSSGGITTGTNTWLNAASSAMATVAKASGGNVYSFQVSNNTGAAVYFRLFNQTTAPTVGTSTPEKTILVPNATTFTFTSDVGLYFGTGIAFDVTTGSLAASDTAAIGTANTVAVNIDYK